MWPFSRKPQSSAPQKKMQAYMFGAQGANWSTNSPEAYVSEGYLRNAAVYMCVDKIAKAVASVKPKIAKQVSGKVEVSETHPALDLLYGPNTTQSWGDLCEAFVSWYLITGNAYLANSHKPDEFVQNKPPVALYVLPSTKIIAKAGRLNLAGYYEYRPTGQDIFLYPVDQVTGACNLMHLMNFNPRSTVSGLPAMQAAAHSVDIFNQGQVWNQSLLQNGARPSGALVVTGTETTLTEEQYFRLKEQIEGQYSGAGNAGRPMLLEGGIDWREMSINPKDMEYSQSMINAARWICGAYNVPPQLIGLPGESTFANMEQAMTWFWTNTVLPLTDKIYSRLSNWLLPAYGDKTAYLVVDHDDLPALEPMRREKSDRINGATFMTINEKRINMGLPPIEEGGDTVLVPAGSVPISMVGEIGLMEPGATGTP